MAFSVGDVLLSEYANENIDVLKVMKMVLIHDIVEVDAGDTYCFMMRLAQLASVSVKRSGRPTFGMLPDDQCKELRELWEELKLKHRKQDLQQRLTVCCTLTLNYTKGGISWQTHGVKYEQVIARNQHTHEGSEALWAYAKRLLETARETGILTEDGVYD